MSDNFQPPHIPASAASSVPVCPRRLLNERLFLKDVGDAPQAPLTGARKMRLRFAAEAPVLVNDAGMVRPETIKGQQ